MDVQKFLHGIDRISEISGKLFAWLIVALAIVVGIEVFKRYILNAPTAWIYDLNSILYGTIFMMCGAYTLAQNGHVRGDFLYGSFRPRTQAGLDLALYVLFFIPGILALIYAGYHFAELSWRQRTFQRHRQRPAGLTFQDRDPGRGRPGHDPGHRGDRALRGLPAHRRMAVASA